MIIGFNHHRHVQASKRKGDIIILGFGGGGGHSDGYGGYGGGGGHGFPSIIRTGGKKRGDFILLGRRKRRSIQSNNN